MKTIIETHSINESHQVKIFEVSNYDYVGYHWELWNNDEKIADSYEYDPYEEKTNALSDAINFYHYHIDE